MLTKSTLRTKISSLIISVCFLFTGVVQAYGIEGQNINAELMTQSTYMTDRGAVCEKNKEEWQVQNIFTVIAKFLLEEKGQIDKLKEVLAKEFENPEKAEELLNGIYFVPEEDIRIKDGVVSIFYTNKDAKRKEFRICKKEGAVIFNTRTGTPWQEFGGYLFKELNAPQAQEKDLKGKDAPITNPLIEKLIQAGKVVEVYMDKTGQIKANRLEWIPGYRPGITSSEIYRGHEIAKETIFTPKEIEELTSFMLTHKVGANTLKFRVIMGEAAIGWQSEKEHSNISHAGVRDSAIYIGSILLKHILKKSQENLREEILDRDEYRHLIGLDHGTDEEHKARLDLVEETIRTSEFDKYRRAMKENDVYFLREQIRKKLNSPEELLDMFSTINDVVLGEPLNPVEASYPIKKAVSLLEEEELERLLNIFTTEDNGNINQLVVNDILIMIEERKTLDEVIDQFVPTQAPQLEGRTIWQVSPEIWHEAGGLARVMQYHGVKMQELLKKSNVKFRQIEPHYQTRLDASGKKQTFDYTKDITHKLKSIEKVVDLEITLDGKPVKVRVSKGVNEFGIEVYLIRDIQQDGTSKYTNMLYNYKSHENTDPSLPTWEEFSVFYSKAALKFIKWQEEQEREDNEDWKAPLVHTNDSQTALVSTYLLMMLDKEFKKKEKDPEYEIDPFLKGVTVFFTTHTYRNRQMYGEGKIADDIMKFMEVPYEYQELFRHWEEYFPGNHVYDVASGGLRSAHGQGAVSGIHGDDVKVSDEWINSTTDPHFRKVFKALKLAPFRLLGIANGDNREKSAEFFRTFLRELYGPGAKEEFPTPTQVLGVKKKAKAQLKLLRSQTYFSSYKDPEEDPSRGQNLLNPDQMVISYSGRLVDEKAGRKRAFTDNNIKTLVRKGAQVVIYGNLQKNISDSTRIYEDLAGLCREIHNEMMAETEEKRKEYGRLVFVPRFSQKNQRALLAATDIQVQDSDKKTEAAGYTESDASANAALQCAPMWRGKGDGLQIQQGIVVDIKKLLRKTFKKEELGRGNTLVPLAPKDIEEKAHDEVDAAYEKAYLKLFTQALEAGQGKLSHYQAASVRISRALEAGPTAAAYLRAFSETIEDKIARERIREMQEEKAVREREKMKLLNWIYIPDSKKDPKGHAIYEISKLVIDGKIKEAATMLFTTEAFQCRTENINVPAYIFNNLLNVYAKNKNKEKKERIEEYINKVTRIAMKLTASDEEVNETTRALQIMAGQVKTVIFWMSQDVEGADNLRLAAKDHKMIQSSKGATFFQQSFLDKETFQQAGIKEVKTEGDLGFFWRGSEGVSKLGKKPEDLKKNVKKEFMYDVELYKRTKEKQLLYIMNHGFVKVPERLENFTKKGKKEDWKTSTLHETFFISDKVEGSLQATSTGPGHFQGRTLDIKQVTEGTGIQFNVLYNDKAQPIQILAQEIRPGDMCFALPGYVDFMVNLGGLRFNDFSVVLPKEIAEEFNPLWDFSDDDKEVSPTISPYTAVHTLEGPHIIKVRHDVPNAVWITQKDAHRLSKTMVMKEGLIKGYKEQTENSLQLLVEILKNQIKDIKTKGKDLPTFSSLTGEEDLLKEESFIALKDQLAKKKESLEKSEAIKTYAEDNLEFLRTVKKKAPDTYKRIRIAVETLKIIGKENIIPFLQELQKQTQFNIELYYAEGFTVTDKDYQEYGIVKKELPEGFSSDRTNTVTIFPFEKGAQLVDSNVNRVWDVLGDMKKTPDKTIVVPVGENYDKTGIIRSLFLGIRLSEIARIEENAGSSFVAYTLKQYMELCFSQGQDPELFDLTPEDLFNIATGDMKVMIESLNKLLRSLPIMPVNIDEEKAAYMMATKTIAEAA